MVGGLWFFRSAREGGGRWVAPATEPSLPYLLSWCRIVLFSPINPPYVFTLYSLSNFSSPLIELSASICPTSIR